MTTESPRVVLSYKVATVTECAAPGGAGSVSAGSLSAGPLSAGSLAEKFSPFSALLSRR